MIGGRLARVVGQAALLGDHGVGAGREHDVAGQILTLEDLVRLVGDDVRARDVDREGQRPLTVVDTAAPVRWHEDAGRHDDRVEPAVGNEDVLEHRRDALTIGDIAGEADRRAAVAEAGAGDANALAVLVDDLLRRRLRRGLVAVHADQMRAFLHQPVSRCLADARAGANDDDDLPIQLLFRRQPAQLCLLERPVLDVEGLLLVHRLVLVDRLGAAHHLDGAVVELGGDARLALVLAPGDHSEAGNQHDRRVGIAHRRRIRPLCTGCSTRRSPSDTARSQ